MQPLHNLMNSHAQSAKFFSFLKFLAVGGSSAIFSAIGLHGLIAYRGWTLLEATVLISIIGNLYGFVLNRQWVFLATHDKPLGQLIRYTMITTAAILLSIGLMGILVEEFSLHYITASLITSATFAIFNFCAHFGWTFRKLSPKKLI